MQYDLNMVPNGSQRVEVSGRFFKYTSGAGKIRVTTNKGAVIDLTVGQGVWGEEYSSLVVQDRSGAGIVGTILAGNYDFRDDTVALSGSVNVSVLNDAAHRVPISMDQNELMKLDRPVAAYTDSWRGTVATLTTGTVFTPAQNTAGMVVEFGWSSTAGMLLVAHTSMPNNSGSTGDILSNSLYQVQNFGDFVRIKIAAGKGLYVCNPTGGSIDVRLLFTDLSKPVP
jgi:hypothetical protein